MGEGRELQKTVHMLDLETWTWVLVSTSTASPPGRCGHSALLVGSKIVVFGGWDKAYFNGCWTQSGGVDAAAHRGHATTPRQGHSELSDGRIVVYAGQAEGKFLTDIRELDTETMAGRARA